MRRDTQFWIVLIIAGIAIFSGAFLIDEITSITGSYFPTPTPVP